jgi:hypothetical protein
LSAQARSPATGKIVDALDVAIEIAELGEQSEGAAALAGPASSQVLTSLLLPLLSRSSPGRRGSSQALWPSAARRRNAVVAEAG